MTFPFTLRDGVVATAPDDSDDYYAAELAHLVMTHEGEREIVPQYGISDPTFQAFDDIEFVGKVGIFGPPVNITGVTQGYNNNNQLDVTVAFDSIDTFNDDDYVSNDAVLVYDQEDDV